MLGPMDLPKVSCVMATQAHRLNHFRRSVAAYRDQTHANRELVVLIDPAPDNVLRLFHEAVTESHAPGVRLEVAARTALGAKRNDLMEMATGDFIAQWDDDDLCHPTRLQMQLEWLQRHNADAVYLMEVFQLFSSERELYWTQFRNTVQGCHAGTAFVRRGVTARYPEEGALATRGEDTEFLLALKRQHRVEMLSGMPFLYVYFSHGANTWDLEHHQMLARKLGLSRALLQRREDEIRSWLTAFDLGSEPLTVMGQNGPAFKL
jgi:hypothetical protein